MKATFLVAAAILAAASADADKSSPAAIAAMTAAVGSALQGDGARAVSVLRGVEPEEFSKRGKAFRACVMARFGEDEDGADEEEEAALSDPAARALLGAYRAYWRDALLAPPKREEALERLVASLNALLGASAGDIQTLEPLVRERLKAAGLHSLQGRTGVLRELMIWGRQDERIYQVELPEGAHQTTVYVLDEFASLGWGDYATCGLRGAGGWATKDALFAVLPRYESLDGEEFRVTFLGHETQHFADLLRFPELESWELEYRAKLVELAQAVETRPRLLQKFTEDQGDDPASPHSYANKRVLAAMRRRLALPEEEPLDGVEIEVLQRAARDALFADSARRATPG